MPSGGYRPPANPASVSGPGALSERTDQPKMALTDAKYGEQAEYQDIQGGAPMGSAGAPAGPGGGMPVEMPVGFGAPTQNPGEAVTTGADAGAGAGSAALSLPKGDTPEELRRRYGPILPALVAESQSQYATQAYKDSVQALLALF